VGPGSRVEWSAGALKTRYQYQGLDPSGAGNLRPDQPGMSPHVPGRGANACALTTPINQLPDASG